MNGISSQQVNERQDEHEKSVVDVRRLDNGAALGGQKASQDVGLGAFHLEACSSPLPKFSMAWCTVNSLYP